VIEGASVDSEPASLDMRAAPLVGFDSQKAAQIAAFFAAQQPNIEKLKLIKLIYLAEREFVARHGHPMLYDELYSLKDGPICSSALNGINGEIDRDYWSKFIALHGRNVATVRPIKRDDLDEISDAELNVLEETWKKFGPLSVGQIRQWTHDHCPEYTEVKSGRVPISYSDLPQAVGEHDTDALEDNIRHTRRVGVLLSPR
jgi:uncharacterized phage-associated protein